MKSIFVYCLITLVALGCSTPQTGNSSDNDGWISLFDGQSLDGWQASENPGTFAVEDGAIVVNGPRAHLFYEGPVMDHDFDDFEFKADVMTTPGSNSGIFIHTAYQGEGWPSQGYEIQVNNSHTDWRRTGSVYAVDDVREVYVPDNEWYTQHIIVRGNTVTVKVNDETIVEYTEPDDIDPATTKRLTSGTVALQGHDPESKVYYKNVMVKPLTR